MSTTKRPRELAELCHDALAEGVIQKHDGLPASWLERFQEDDRIMAQLQTLVMESDTREDVLKKNSLVTMVVMNSGLLSCLRMWQVEAGHLGHWQYALLEAYFQGMQWSEIAFNPEEDTTPEHEPLGGYQIGWDADDLKRMWGDLVRWHHGYCHRRRSSMYVELTHMLLECFGVDIKTQYDSAMQVYLTDSPTFFDGWEPTRIVDFFPSITEAVVCAALCKELKTHSNKREWMWNMYDTMPDSKDPPCNRVLQRASFCTLFIDMREPGLHRIGY
tara:strand:+ start:1149 stop:1970 length:822 start_codon:yes stop_codon:yes gene_type:complete